MARCGKALALTLALTVTLGASPLAAQEVTIAALGDSLTAGFGLPQGEGLVPQLEAWLSERGHDARVVNAGVSGDTTAGGLSRTAWTLTPDVDSMIVALGGNDLLRGIDPAVSRANLAGILEAAQAQGVEVLLVGLTASANYGPEFQQSFNAMYPDLAAEYDTLLQPDIFEGMRQAIDDGAPVVSLMLPDGIHPSAEGVARMIDALGPRVEALIARAIQP